MDPCTATTSRPGFVDAARGELVDSAVGRDGYWTPLHVRWSATFAALVLAATVVSLGVPGNALQGVLASR